MWIKISGIPTNCWNKKYINVVASEISGPISFDEVTRSSFYAHFARVLVEKPVGSDFSLQIEMLNEKKCAIHNQH